MDAALLLVEGACESLAARPDLRMRLETDWLTIAEWRSPAELNNRLRGRPFAITIAEYSANPPHRNVVAAAEIWLTGTGEVLTFRLGEGALLEADANGALKAEAEALDELTEGTVNRVLVEGGARFPPGDPLRVRRRAEAFLEKISPLIGRAAIDEIEFAPLPLRQKQGSPWERQTKPTTTRIVLEWFIRARTPKADLFLRLDAVSGNVLAVQSHGSR